MYKPLRPTSVPRMSHTLLCTPHPGRTSIPYIRQRNIHTSPCHHYSTPSLFNLSALSNSRETHALSKASGLGLQNHSTLLQQLDAESRAHLDAKQPAEITAAKTSKSNPFVKTVKSNKEGPKTGQSSEPSSSDYARTKNISIAPSSPAANSQDLKQLVEGDIPPRDHVTQEEFGRLLDEVHDLRHAMLKMQPNGLVWAKAVGGSLTLLVWTLLAITYVTPWYLNTYSRSEVDKAQKALMLAAPKIPENTAQAKRRRQRTKNSAVSTGPISPPKERVPPMLSWLWQSSSAGR